ncbi:signal peptidase I [Candidatus Collierbacteria bacterium CG10_big_fil_rev_8_21_14_0_10_44_9]|uniref:Signal peptidase I n=1 Tax=Candidatus Collierbacteria bacterium CG10_big_fil_rev_8_21_14_0_10_44_9 TaxID=1974535 RepID=A0A2H0VKN2_9BACT|nr:MAG: signal peptidase I [Candidatus Collierbacteria bacterium CG10_big_fil_rev_8_21_14_0_10_44_9]
MTEEQRPIKEDLGEEALSSENPHAFSSDVENGGKPAKEKKKKNKLKSFFWNFFFYVVIIGGIVFGLPKFLVWKLNTQYPMAAITSGSMWPVLKQGDMVFIKGIQSSDQVQVGDIIVFRNRANGTLTIHRVIKLGDKITTKGDANFSEDAPVDYKDVIGETLNWSSNKPVRIPKMGSITIFTKSLRQGETNESGGEQ